MYSTVSILFGTVDRPRCVANLLSSITRYTRWSNYELIVVDGGTNYSSWSVVKDNPRVQYYQDTAKAGFSRAYNRGSRLATGEYLVWLNDDCLITQPGWLTAIVEFMNYRLEVGIGGISFSEVRGKKVKQSILGIYYPNFGCIRTSLWRRLNGFDERYYSYGAETDLAFRVLEAGFSVVPIPGVVITHLRHMDKNREEMAPYRSVGINLFRRIWCERVHSLPFLEEIK